MDPGSRSLRSLGRDDSFYSCPNLRWSRTRNPCSPKALSWRGRRSFAAFALENLGARSIPGPFLHWFDPMALQESVVLGDDAPRASAPPRDDRVIETSIPAR